MPDTLWVDKNAKVAWMVDIAVPANHIRSMRRIKTRVWNYNNCGYCSSNCDWSNGNCVQELLPTHKINRLNLSTDATASVGCIELHEYIKNTSTLRLNLSCCDVTY